MSGRLKTQEILRNKELTRSKDRKRDKRQYIGHGYNPPEDGLYKDEFSQEEESYQEQTPDIEDINEDEVVMETDGNIEPSEDLLSFDNPPAYLPYRWLSANGRIIWISSGYKLALLENVRQITEDALNYISKRENELFDSECVKGAGFTKVTPLDLEGFFIKEVFKIENEDEVKQEEISTKRTITATDYLEKFKMKIYRRDINGIIEEITFLPSKIIRGQGSPDSELFKRWFCIFCEKEKEFKEKLLRKGFRPENDDDFWNKYEEFYSHINNIEEELCRSKITKMPSKGSFRNKKKELCELVKDDRQDLKE